MFALTGIGHLVTNNETIGQGKLGVLHDAALVAVPATRILFIPSAMTIPPYSVREL